MVAGVPCEGGPAQKAAENEQEAAVVVLRCASEADDAWGQPALALANPA